MGFYGQAEAAAQRILRAFEDTNSLPKPLAQVFIRRNGRPHYRKWSWGNQLLVVLHNYTDARTFNQWQEVGRKRQEGREGVLHPRPVDEEAAKRNKPARRRSIIVGFKGLPVFGLEQTEGTPLPAGDANIEKWVDSLPLLDVAKRWGLSVRAVDGAWADFLGCYRRGKRIEVAVKNLSTWCTNSSTPPTTATAT